MASSLSQKLRHSGAVKVRTVRNYHCAVISTQPCWSGLLHLPRSRMWKAYENPIVRTATSRKQWSSAMPHKTCHGQSTAATPDNLLVANGTPDAVHPKLNAALAGVDGALVDQTYGRCVWAQAGQCALDGRPPGIVASTMRICPRRIPRLLMRSPPRWYGGGGLGGGGCAGK